ncbi:threonyl-tRNA synthetase editing domain-containing protein [Carboxylicivirga marina]|uniref:threonyl-tRNA synthetase editing domain-containing protein n=1 Tax=Carboxylicivirga marina TaxID=2800988 RepID=UPI0025933263|nr:threonyl-tRNA synthetase editing domain-containing protein [uncultured Carboxylicivirga sp.]
MKVLIFYTRQFSYSPSEKNIDNAPDPGCAKSYNKCLLAFIQIEEADEEKGLRSREKKLANHLKWAARKNNTKKIVLHSFAHLSDSKASIDFTKQLFDDAQTRLENVDYEVAQTPFGYFLDLKIDAPGFSLARIWAEL